MKFALITADPAHKISFKMNEKVGDCTSFMQWIEVFEGVLLSFAELRKEDNYYLKGFDVVMMSGHPHYISDIIRIANFLKDSDTITMFYPEGSTQQYEDSISNFHKEYFEAWNVCDIFSMAEEDKQSYYEAFIHSDTIVRFIHVPIRKNMEKGEFFLPVQLKNPNQALVYCDNNSNHPLIAIACAMKLGMSVRLIESRGSAVWEAFPKGTFYETPKLGQWNFLYLLSRTFLHFYPTAWIGTARQPIACACAGTPCIGNRDSHTQQRLWPDLCFEIHDMDGMIETAKRLLTDPPFYFACVKHAFEGLSFYGLEATKKRFIEAVEAARTIKGKVSIQGAIIPQEQACEEIHAGDQSD